MVCISKKLSNRNNSGLSLVEIVVATAILLLIVTGLLTSYSLFTRVSLQTLATIQATYLLEEGLEVMTTLRDHGWDANIASLNSGTNYYLTWNGARWVTTTTATTTDSIFTRYVTVANVSRNASDAIVAVGTNDPGTKKITAYVSWTSNATTTTRSMATYITNLFNN